MRYELVVPSQSEPDVQGLFFHATTIAREWIPLIPWLLMPFVVGLLVGAAFTWIVKGRGWRTQIIPIWSIPVMFGTLAYAVIPCVLYIATAGFWPSSIMAGLVASLLLAWPIWLVMGPLFFAYITYLKKRQKWLRDSTVIYLSAFSLTSECVFISWLSH